MTRELVETPRFTRALRKYTRRDGERQACVADTLLRMGADVFDPRLKTHALTGELAGRYACACGYDCRIVFSLAKDTRTKKEKVLLLDVGTHDEVY
jgi:mRNA interferase YafQ